MRDAAALSGRALRLGLLTHSVHPRGGVVHTIELARALRAAGHQPVVFAPAAAGQRFFRDSGCVQVPVPVGRAPRGVHDMVLSRVAAFVEHIAASSLRDAVDVWHAHDGIGGNALHTLARRGLVGPWVRTVHHLDHFDDRRMNVLQERGWRGAAALCCVSRLWRDRLAAEYGAEAMQVNNGVDLERFRPRAQPGDAAALAAVGLNAGDPARLVLAVGGVEARKNTVALLHAVARLRREGEAVRLLVAGGVSLLDHDAYLRSFHEAAQAHGLEVGPATSAAPVVLTGGIADEHMPALLRRADVLAMPSLSEGFGLVVLEALACGTPVVTSNIAPFTEYLDDTLVDWADPHDAGAIAFALRRAMSRGHSPTYAESVHALLHRYSWTASARRHVALYRSLLPARPSHDGRPRAAPVLPSDLTGSPHA